jgi:hypothetical protein
MNIPLARNLVVLLLLLPPPLAAQTRLFVLTEGASGIDCTLTDCEPGMLMEIDADTDRLISRTPIVKARYRHSAPAPTSDGRFVIWTGSEGLHDSTNFTVFDRKTRTLLTRSLSAPTAVLTHPSMLTAFYTRFPLVSGPRTVIALTLQGERELVTDDCPLGWLTGISKNGERLFMDCLGYFNVVSTLTGSITTIPASGFPTSFTYSLPNSEGSEMYSTEANVLAGNVLLRRYDVATGAVLAERYYGPASTAAPRLLGIDPGTNNLYALQDSSSPAALLVMNGATLSVVATVPLGSFPLADGRAAIAFARDAPRAYVVWTQVDGGSHRRSAIAALDTLTMTLISQFDLGVRSGPAGVAIVPMPGRSTNLAVSVTGSQVTLNWQQEEGTGITTTYMIEVGLSSGATNVAIPLPPATRTISAPGVPAGTYYVRVRGANEIDLGAASNEVKVIVP